MTELNWRALIVEGEHRSAIYAETFPARLAAALAESSDPAGAMSALTPLPRSRYSLPSPEPGVHFIEMPGGTAGNIAAWPHRLATSSCSPAEPSPSTQTDGG